MMKFMRKSKGFISIFLCLVMLPMVTFASMVIDVSRLQSARAFLTSAGDLTMNAGLSEYESTLQELYGLFATVTDENELQTALESYFTKTITSTIGTGSESEEQYIQNMASDIATAILSTSDYSTIDFTNLVEMQMDDASGDSFTYSGVENSALANPAIMKQQIVDYMKYKGPISIVSTVLTKLKFLKDSSNQTTAVQKKVEYTQTLNELEDPCEDAYAKIIGTDVDDKNDDIGYNDYVEVYNKLVENGDYSNRLTKMEEYFNNMSQYIYYYYQVENSKEDFDGFTYENMKKKTIDLYGDIENYSAYGKGTKDNIDALIGEFKNLVDYESTYKGDFEVYFGNVYVGFTDGEVNSLEFKDQPSDNTMNACWNNLKDWESTLKLPTGGTVGPDEKYDKRYELQIDLCSKVDSLSKFVRFYEQIKSLDSKVQEAWSDYKSNVESEAGSEFDDMVTNNPDDYKDCSSAELDSLREAYISDALPEDKKEAVNLLNKIVDKLEADYKPLYENVLTSLNNTECYKEVANACVSMALDQLSDFYIIICKCESQAKAVNEKLDDVLQSIGKVETARNNWDSAISNVEDDTMKTNFQNDYDSMTNGIEKQDVENLKTVVTGCETFFSDLRTKIESIKFFDVQVFYDGTKFDVNKASESHFKKFFAQDEYKEKCSIDDIDTADEIKTKAENLNSTKLVVGEAANVSFGIGNKIDGKKAAKTPTEEDPNEKFFYTLQSICNPKESSDDKDETVKKVQDIQEGADKESTNYTKDSEGNDKSTDTGTDTDNGGASSVSFDFDDVMGDINSYVSSTNTGTDGIDSKDGSSTKDIDVSSDDDYSKSADNASSSLGAAASVLSMFTDLADKAVEKAYLEEYFTEMFTCQTDVLNDETKAKKLLNGKAIADLNQNTEWYGYEMEYLIWGDSDMSANRIKNEAMIFTIRFALNTIYAFTASDIQTFALQTATAIGGWCVIGVPIIQACITVALAMAESAYDLCRLKAGEDVPIYKNNTNFVCSPTGFMKTAITEITTSVIDKVSTELGEKINEGIDKIAEKGETLLSDCTDEINQLVKDYTDQQTENLTSLISSNFTTPIINKITPVLTLAEQASTTLENELDKAIDEAFEVIGKNLNDNSTNSNDSVVKELSLMVYQNISDSAKQALKQELLDVMKDKDAISATDVTNIIDNKVKAWVNRISSEITNKADEMAKQLKEEINAHGDEAASNIKSIVGDKINTISSNLTEAASDKISQHLKDGALSKTDVSASGGVTLNYKEYCKIFMLINVIADENKVLKRCAALIQANVCNAAEDPNSDFDITKANTLVSVNARVKMGTLFPWAVSVSENTSTGQSNLSVDLSHLGSNYVTIEYSGVCGY